MLLYVAALRLGTKHTLIVIRESRTGPTTLKMVAVPVSPTTLKMVAVPVSPFSVLKFGRVADLQIVRPDRRLGLRLCGIDVEPLADDLRRHRPKLRRLDPAKDQLGPT